MPLSKAGKNAIQAHAAKRFPFLPATATTEATNQPIIQSQTQAGVDTSGGSAPGIRPRLLQTINPEPVREVMEEDRLKKLAKVNALGTALGSLGQLAGVASGGDAVHIENSMSPFVMNKMAYLDDDYRNQLQQHTNRAFAMDRFNIDQQNQDIQDGNNNEFRKEQIQLQGQKEMEVAKHRAQLELDQFNRKTDAEKAAEMRAIGIDPRDAKAMDKYIARTNQKYGIDTGYRKSLTAENYANANKTAAGDKSKENFDLDTMKRGVNTIVSDLRNQLGAVKNLPFAEREAAAKRINDEITFWERQYNPKTNELLNDRVLDAAGGEQPSETSGGFGEPYTPGKGLAMNQPTQQAQPAQGKPSTERSREEITDLMNANRISVLQRAKQIATLNMEDPDPETANFILEKAQELVDLGVFETEDEAIESIIKVAQSNQADPNRSQMNY